MPKGPFASSVGVGRAEPEWAALNKVTAKCGTDAIAAAGEAAEGPLPLPADVLSGDLSTAPRKVDLLIVGAGLSGAVIAERCSKELGMTSLILDQRDHIGGNCHDYLEEHGIRASKYGAHLFHTQHQHVWEYLQAFSQWTPWEHRVLARVGPHHVPVPVNIDTVNTLFAANLSTSADMRGWLAERQVRVPADDVTNSEQVCSATPASQTNLA